MSEEDNTHKHAHGHSASCNGHHDHAAHADLDTADGRSRVAIACVITAIFMVVEAIGGLISGSLALLADAAHMLTDSASLALAWLGYWFASKAPDESRSFGFGRMRVLAAFTNGIVLIGLSVWIVVEGLLRMMDPQPVLGIMMLWVAIGGLIVNLIAAFVLHGGDNNDINLSGALWHVLGDLLGSVAAIVAAVIIVGTGWTIFDPLLSMLVAFLVLLAGIRITHRAGHILLQGAPEDLTPTIISEELLDQIDGVLDVQDIHVWLLTEGEPIVTLCIVAEEDVCAEKLLDTVKQYLVEEMNVHLSTVEITYEPEYGPLSVVPDPMLMTGSF